MSRLHPDVIGAAYSHFDDSAEKCARRVLATLAKPECISDGMVEAACIRYHDAWDCFHERAKKFHRQEFRAAISATLEYAAKEGE